MQALFGDKVADVEGAIGNETEAGTVLKVGLGELEVAAFALAGTTSFGGFFGGREVVVVDAVALGRRVFAQNNAVFCEPFFEE